LLIETGIRKPRISKGVSPLAKRSGGGKLPHPERLVGGRRKKRTERQPEERAGLGSGDRGG